MIYNAQQNEGKNMISVNTVYLYFFLNDISTQSLSLEDADQEQTHFVNELKNIGKGKLPVEKIYFF